MTDKPPKTKRPSPGRPPRAQKRVPFTVHLEPDSAKAFRSLCRRRKISQSLQVEAWVLAAADYEDGQKDGQAVAHEDGQAKEKKPLTHEEKLAQLRRYLPV